MLAMDTQGQQGPAVQMPLAVKAGPDPVPHVCNPGLEASLR